MKTKSALMDLLEEVLGEDHIIPELKTIREDKETNSNYGIFGSIKKFVDENGKLPSEAH